MKQLIAHTLLIKLHSCKVDLTMVIKKYDMSFIELLSNRNNILQLSGDVQKRISRDVKDIKLNKINTYVCESIFIVTYNGKVVLCSQISESTGFEPTKKAVHFAFTRALKSVK